MQTLSDASTDLERSSGVQDAHGEPLLRCQEVRKSFAGVQALRGVSLDIRAGVTTALIGPNGAGKTTLFNCMSGFLRPDSGELWFKGDRTDKCKPHTLARRGLVRTFQSIRMIPGYTVYESVLLGRYSRRGDRSLRRIHVIGKRERSEVEDILELLGLADVLDRRCTELPLLLQRKVEVARAVAQEPDLLLLDEPSAGATRAEARDLAAVIRTLEGRGVTVLVIEHNVPFVMEAAHWVAVMNFGEIVAQGTTEDVRSNPVVREIYLGVEE
jgi:branched-chain amino acid transport system ATP-binding protein